MHAERVLLETDAQGNLLDLPKLPPNVRLKAIFLVLEELSPALTKRRPHPAIAGKGETTDDLVLPIVGDSEWEAA